MSQKTKIVTIDLGKWISQVDYAKERGTTPQYVSRLIKQGKLNTFRIDSIGLVLVERPTK
jgi:predicted transcriptional regulator